MYNTPISGPYIGVYRWNSLRRFEKKKKLRSKRRQGVSIHRAISHTMIPLQHLDSFPPSASSPHSSSPPQVTLFRQPLFLSSPNEYPFLFFLFLLLLGHLLFFLLLLISCPSSSSSSSYSLVSSSFNFSSSSSSFTSASSSSCSSSVSSSSHFLFFLSLSSNSSSYRKLSTSPSYSICPILCISLT